MAATFVEDFEARSTSSRVRSRHAGASTLDFVGVDAEEFSHELARNRFCAPPRPTLATAPLALPVVASLKMLGRFCRGLYVRARDRCDILAVSAITATATPHSIVAPSSNSIIARDPDAGASTWWRTFSVSTS